VIFAPIAAVAICDFRRRVADGRRGIVSGGAAFWPAIVGLIAAAIADAEDAALVGAGICAALSLLGQSAAAMWPLRPTRPIEPDLVGAAAGPTAEERLGMKRSPAQTAEAGPEAPPESADAQSSKRPPTASSGQQQSAVEAAAPSFAGGTANAGAAFLGKILLLAGLVLALGQGPFLDYASSEIESGAWKVDRDFSAFVEHGIPGGVVILALIFGILLLLVARRREGAWHFVRGCFGSLAIFVGAMMGMIAGKEGYRILFGQADLTELFDQGDGVWGPVVGSALLLGFGALVFLWPGKQQRNKPIVL
jgi:hypothetical protein